MLAKVDALMAIKAICSRPLKSALLAVASLALAACSEAAGARAQERAVYTISDNDGYGIADCMHSGSACGRAMADSWCEAHGHGHALSYGSSEDVTGKVQVSRTLIEVADGSVVIRCGD